MPLILAFIIGCVIGWRRAAARGGSAADKAQYAVAHGFAGLLLLLVASLFLGFAGLSPFG
jgi:hypothetical protein